MGDNPLDGDAPHRVRLLRRRNDQNDRCGFTGILSKEPFALIRFRCGQRNSSEGALAGSKLSMKILTATERK
jgi:hypothetical protein